MRYVLPPVTLRDPFTRSPYALGLKARRVHQQVCHEAPVTIHEADSGVTIELDVPGFTIEDLEISVSNNELNIKGHRQLNIPSSGKVLLNSRQNVSVERRLRIDDSLDPDSVDAVLEFGVLKIELTRRPESQPHPIRIRLPA